MNKILAVSITIALLLVACAPPVLQPQPTPSPSADNPLPVRIVRMMLAQQLGLLFDDIQVVRLEAVDWSNTCLGIDDGVHMCAEVVTPGYRVVLQADGKEYIYHTNQSGDLVYLASAPGLDGSRPVIQWESNECEVARLGEKGIEFGGCRGSLLAVPWMDGLMPQRMQEFLAIYAPFEAETPAGSLEFDGTGPRQASPAEKRSIAEWVRLTYTVYQAGRAGAAWQLAFTWHREGGIAGFCDDVNVFLTGEVVISSCAAGSESVRRQFFLDATQLEKLYSWVDTFRGFDLEYADPAEADRMKISIVFSGKGSINPVETDIQEINQFASALTVQAEPTPVSGGGYPEPVHIVIDFIAKELGVSRSEVRVVSIEPFDWPDSCLGVEVAGQMCLMVITPGYRIVLEAKGNTYVFHTDSTGRNVRAGPSP